MPRLRPSVWVMAVCCCWDANAYAKDEAVDLLALSLDQLANIPVVTATKTDSPWRTTPAVVTVLTAEDLAVYGYRTVAEALAHVAGFVETDDQLTHNFGVRGSHAGARAGSRPIKFLLDGQAISFRSNQQQFLGLELLPISAIERIEVVRGPVSVLYGADALLGAVNIITRRSGAKARLGVWAERAESGPEGIGASASGAGQQGDWWYSWAGQGAEEDRSGLRLPRISPDYQRFAQRPRATRDEAAPRNVYLRAGRAVDYHELLLSAYWQRLDADFAFSDLNPLLAPSSHVALEQGFARLDYSQHLGQSSEVRTRVAYARGTAVAGDRIETGARDYYLSRDLGYAALDLGVEWLWQPDTGNSVLIGAAREYDRETIETFQRQPRAGGASFPLSRPDQEVLRNLSAYGQWQFPLSARWQGILGGRVDDHSVYASQSSYRGGLVGDLPSGWSVKLLAGTAFQAPSPELLYRRAVQPGDILGNPALTPQKARTVELQLAAPTTSHWQAALTVYRTRVQDLVSFQQEFFNLVARNSSASTAHGAELELRWRYDALQGYANVSVVDSQVDPDRLSLVPLAQREQAALFPRLSGNLGLTTGLFDQRLRLSLDNRYVGKRKASTQNVLLANQDYELSSYTDSTLTASWNFSATSLLRAQVRDLWDANYVDPGFGGIDYPSRGRRYSVSYEQKF